MSITRPSAPRVVGTDRPSRAETPQPSSPFLTVRLARKLASRAGRCPVQQARDL